MTYIIQHDFNQDTPYYVKTVDNTEFQEIYNPKIATQFKTKKEAQQWIDVYSSMKSHSKVVDFEKSVQKYEEWVNGGTVRRTLACINRTMSRKYNNESLEDIIDWWIYQRNNDDEIDFDDYKTWPQLHTIAKHLWDVEGYHSKDYKEIYITFEIYTPEDGNFEDFQRELNMVMDKVTYKDDDGFLIMPIFDHFLSEHGNSVSLLIHPETKQVKVGGRWRKEDFSSLKEAFNYMRRERYYE
jgi:hypothetical protein